MADTTKHSRRGDEEFRVALVLQLGCIICIICIIGIILVIIIIIPVIAITIGNLITSIVTINIIIIIIIIITVSIPLTIQRPAVLPHTPHMRVSCACQTLTTDTFHYPTMPSSPTSGLVSGALGLPSAATNRATRSQVLKRWSKRAGMQESRQVTTICSTW